jgi:hypothetical protein
MFKNSIVEEFTPLIANRVRQEMKETMIKSYSTLTKSYFEANKGKSKMDFFFSRGSKEAAVARGPEDILRVEYEAFSNFLEGFVQGLHREDDNMITKYTKAMQMIRR